MLRNLRQRGSNVKWKLENYIETGQLKKASDAQYARKGSAKKTPPKEGISQQKALLLLKAKYDSFPFQTMDGEALSLNSIRLQDMKVKEPRLMDIFQNLLKIRKMARKPIDANLLMTLLGVNKSTIQDPYFVTRDVIQLLEHDNDTSRALELCRLAPKEAATVGMNSILEWCLEKNRTDLADKVVATRKKWGIPENAHSSVIYFNGVANCHEWGKLSDRDAEKIVSRFDSSKNKSTAVFNAALKALVKNYTNNQAAAWAFFSRLEDEYVHPDIQTFLTFLLGIQKFHRGRAEQARCDLQITALKRASLLFQAQAQVVAAAQVILDKVLLAATPPVPPTKEEAEHNPQLLQTYKARTRDAPMDIDRHFVAIFLLSFVNPQAGTSWSSSAGSHYTYLQNALRYFDAWVPEIREMSESAAQAKLGVDVSPEVKRKTDARVAKSEIAVDFLPAEDRSEDLNPLVVFPPSPFSHNKGRAIFSNKQKPLVDLTREKWADLRKRYGEKSENRNSKSDRKSSQGPFAVNKFLLRSYLETLLQLGLHHNFYLAMWTSLNRWAGIRNVSLQKIAQKMSIGAIKPEDYARVNLDIIGDEQTPNTHVETSIIDINLIEDFVYKIDENFSENAAGYALEVVSALCRPKVSSVLKPRPATFNAVFSMLNRQIYRFNDRNRTLGRKQNAVRSLQDNTAKHSLTAAQLHEILDNLQILMESIMVRFNRISVDTFFVESYNKLVERLYAVTWADATANHQHAVSLHLKVIRSGILMYRPRSLVPPTDKRAYATPIVRSMEFVYEKYKNRDDLSETERKTMLSLRDLFQALRGADESAFESAQRKLFSLTK